jgi:type VI secretion system secreted protein Hcp
MAVDMFLKIDDVEGESRDDKHKGEIDVQSYSWGAANVTDAAHGSGAAAGKVSLQDFHFVMHVSKASPTLFQACASGRHFKQALLTVRKAGESPLEFLKVTMTDVLVSSFQSGGAGSDVPMEQLSLNFSKVELFYKEQKADGSLASVQAGWDWKTNSGG